MICAPAFNHKIGNAAHSRVSSRNLISGRNNGERNGQLEDNSLLKISNAAGIQDGCSTDVSTTEI